MSLKTSRSKQNKIRTKSKQSQKAKQNHKWKQSLMMLFAFNIDIL